MSEHTPRMNRLLIFVAVFLCLICGILFTQSSAGPFESSSTSVVSINTSDISTIEPSSDRVTIQMHRYLPALPHLPPHRLLFPQRFPKQKRFRRRQKTESGHRMAPTGNLWLTEPPIPDGLPTQMVIVIISTRTESCRPAGSP